MGFLEIHLSIFDDTQVPNDGEPPQRKVMFAEVNWHTSGNLQDGAPKIAKLPYKWLYGRYNYS